jgi:hypothetical protein
MDAPLLQRSSRKRAWGESSANRETCQRAYKAKRIGRSNRQPRTASTAEKCSTKCPEDLCHAPCDDQEAFSFQVPEIS